MTQIGENIYRRKDGRWEGRYIKDRTEAGKIKYGYIYGPTFQQVKEKLKTQSTRYQKPKASDDDNQMKLIEWIEIWLNENKEYLKPSTRDSYVFKMNQYIIPYLGELELNELSNATIQTLVNQLQREGRSTSTLRVTFGILKRCLTAAVVSEILLQSPYQKIVFPKAKANNIHALSRWEQKKLEMVVKSDGALPSFAVLLALRTGMRIGEIAALHWQDIDFSDNKIFVRHTITRVNSPKQGNKKTNLTISTPKTLSSLREIPISSQLKAELLKYKKQTPIHEFIFSNSPKPYDPRLLTYYFHKIRRTADLEHITFHQLRHTFATRCLESKADIMSVSAILGHASTQMTLDIYADSLFDERRKTLAKMEKSLQ
ncbi:tyrosine-type recombinase/integrase [Enterococcus alishanensis]|uniref:Site-specific integrase n=1 Tax=Enterococcus alishanensis TaxID=1303817 RepID=A0ABS6TCH1_9ENTE|nr:site-specific integrase [Enterococcus alishanensis]MBV7390599.1 site-specific integrase [Enterococcus alishanensis]